MRDVVIRVDNLSKQYTIGGAERATNMRELLTRAMTPRKWFDGASRQPKKTFWALNDVSFEVKRGEVLGVIGRNGAGKSTLLKVLSRITEPTEGRVVAKGTMGTLLEVGTGFHPELSGRENVYMNGAILGMRQEEVCRRFDEIVAFSEVDNFIDTPVKYYSSGMYLRLAFSVAAHLEPDILIVDEVLAVGDAIFQRKCLQKMNDVAGEGRTVLFVSHNMSAVKQLTKTAIVLNHGTIAYSGPTEDAVQQYLSELLNNENGGNQNRAWRRLEAKLDRRIEFVDVAVRGKNVKMPGSRSAVELEITLRKKAEVEDCRVSFSILKLDGLVVGSGFSDPVLLREKEQVQVLTMKIELDHLAPGKYYLGLGVGKGGPRGGNLDFDVITDVGPIEVLPERIHDMVAEKWEESWGVVRFSANLTLNEDTYVR